MTNSRGNAITFGRLRGNVTKTTQIDECRVLKVIIIILVDRRPYTIISRMALLYVVLLDHKIICGTFVVLLNN